MENAKKDLSKKNETMWILTEPTELRSINNQKWYAHGILYPITGLDDCTQVYIISKKKEIEKHKNNYNCCSCTYDK